MNNIFKNENVTLLEKLLNKFRKPQSQLSALMPLSAISLSACGGGSGETTPIKTSTVVNGSVHKGQITNALVFSDLNSNGVFDTSEPSAYTDVNGKFNLTTSDTSAKLIALGQVGSIDKSTGASAASIDFSGTSSGTIISPFSTVITEGGITSKELADSLGLGDVDLLNFNPFAEGVDAAKALLVENTSHQLENVINSFIEASKGSGLTAGEAKKTALESFAAAAKEKLALKETLNLSNDVDVAAISANVTKSMTLTIAEAESLKTKFDTVSTALKNVNSEVKKVADLTSDATKGAYSLGQLLKDQIADSFSKATNIDLVDSAKVTAAAANLAPNEIKITSAKVTENATDLSVGRFSATDEDVSSIVYSLAGTDAAKFNLSETGELSLKSAANYEIQNSYELVLNVEDAGGKKSASKFQIDVENVNDAATGSVSIAGTAKEGAVLTANISEIVDEDSSDIASIAKYQWLRDGTKIEGATSKALTLSQSDVASALSLNVNYKDGSDTTETFSSSATANVINVNDSPLGTLKITGTTAQEDILTADTSNLSDIDGLGTFSYQWMRDGTAISGETKATLTLGETDVGKKIVVTVTYTDKQGTSEIVTSASTNAISNKNDAPTGSVTLSGEAVEGKVLTLDTSTIADADGLGDFKISWSRDGEAISGVTSSNYTLSQKDVGKSITAKLTYTDKGGVTENITSNTIAATQNVNDHPTGSITISGDLTKGSTLTLDTTTVKDEDGLGTFSIEWLRDSQIIEGEEATTYTLTSSDVDKTILAKITYIDGQGTSESLSSDASQKVENVIPKVYTSGNLILDSTNGTWFDRSIEVYGMELVIAGEVGGQSKVPDEWAKKAAQTIKLMIDPDAAGIDLTSQTNMIATLAGDAGTWHAGQQTGQRVAYGGGDDYSPNPLPDSGIASYEGYEAWLDSTVQNDMVWYQNSSNGAVTTSGDTDIQELLEHLMHTVHLYGVRGGVNGSDAALNADVEQAGWNSTELYFALKEAVDNGAFDITGYGDGDYTNPNTYAVASKEYTYVLNFGMWEYGSEFWPDKDANGLGSLAPEWADNVRTPAGVQENNPLGYALFNKYFSPVLSKPDVATLRSMFQENDGGLSGYVADVFSESIGAISVVNSGTNSAPTLDFYLDKSKDKDGDGVTSLDVILKFDPTDASFTSFSHATGLTGFANESEASDGTVTFAGIALSGVSTDKPLFTMNMSDLDSAADFVLTLSDVNVDGLVLDGSTLII